jgi:DNA-binding CsgD family transcriptional regulator
VINERIASLTPRQLQIVRFVASGLTNKEIPRKLGMEEAGIKSCLRLMLGAFGLRNRTQLAIVGVALTPAGSGRERRRDRSDDGKSRRVHFLSRPLSPRRRADARGSKRPPSSHAGGAR